MFKPYIRLGKPSIKGNRVTIEVLCSQSVKAYLSTPYFWYESDSIGDLRSIPDGILAIPIVGNLVTVAWALGATFHVARLDGTYAESLGRVQSTVADLYPALAIRRSRLDVKILERNTSPDMGDVQRAGLLFSGGLDSITSLIEHQHRVTDLLSAWGVDVGTEDRLLWHDGIMRLVTDTCAKFEHVESHVVRTNVKEGISQDWLNTDVGKYLTNSSWWGSMQHGLGLASLIAPLAFAQGIRELLVASSYTESFDPPWGSMPQIDNDIAWTGTTVTHDGFHRSRQDKIQQVVAPYIEASGATRIASCWQADRGTDAINCGTCEKCVRTQSGLLLAGVDPVDCGFTPTDNLLSEATTWFTDGTFGIGDDEVFMWQDIQSHIPPNLDGVPDRYGSRAFFSWLADTDVQRFLNRQSSSVSPILPTHPFYFLNRIGRALPPRLQQSIKRMLNRPEAHRILQRF